MIFWLKVWEFSQNCLMEWQPLEILGTSQIAHWISLRHSKITMYDSVLKIWEFTVFSLMEWQPRFQVLCKLLTEFHNDIMMQISQISLSRWRFMYDFSASSWEFSVVLLLLHSLQEEEQEIFYTLVQLKEEKIQKKETAPMMLSSFKDHDACNDISRQACPSLASHDNQFFLLCQGFRHDLLG